MSATVPRFLWRSVRDRNLKARIETLTEPQLRVLFSQPRVEARVNSVAKWLKLSTTPRALSVLHDVPMQSDPEEVVDSLSDASKPIVPVPVSATLSAPEPEIVQSELDRIERVWIITELIYYLIEVTYRADFSIQAIRASLLVFLETHQALCRNPIADMDQELAYFRRLLFSTMVAQPPSYLPLLSRVEGKLVYQHVLSAYFRQYHLYKHIFSHGPMAPPVLLGPPNSLHTSLVAGLADSDCHQAAGIAEPTVGEPVQNFVQDVPQVGAGQVGAGESSPGDSTKGGMTATVEDCGALDTLPDLSLPPDVNLEQVSEQLVKLRLEWNTKLDAMQQLVASRKASNAVTSGPGK